MHQKLQQAVTRALTPLVRLLLRHGISHAEFANWAKQTYVEQAQQHFGIGGKPPTQSRIAIVTGINRKEVKRILDLPADVDTGVSKHNRALRVVTAWLQDPAFLDDEGNPLVLDYGESNDTFNQLVKRHAGDVPARALLDELMRVGTVAFESGKVTLLTHGYIPSNSEDAMLDMFATSARDLLNTLEHNLHTGDNRLQLSVAYDNLSQSARNQFRELSGKRAMTLLRALDTELSRNDRDLHPDLHREGQGQYRCGLGIYLIEEEIEAPAGGHHASTRK